MSLVYPIGVVITYIFLITFISYRYQKGFFMDSSDVYLSGVLCVPVSMLWPIAVPAIVLFMISKVFGEWLSRR